MPVLTFPLFQRFYSTQWATCTTLLLLANLLLGQTAVGNFGREWSGIPENPMSGLEDACLHTSPYFTQNSLYLPEPGYTPITIRVNYIFLQNQNGEGNFNAQDSSDQAFIQAFTNRLNDTYQYIVERDYAYCKSGLPFRSDAKIRFEVKQFYIKDEFSWNNRHDVAPAGCPGGDQWYLDKLDDGLYNDPAIPRGINVYFSTDGQQYQDMVVQKTRTDFEKHKYLANHCASEIGAVGDVNPHSMRVHLPDAWLKLWWFKYITKDPQEWLINEFGRSIAHEIGHLLGLSHTANQYTHTLMRTAFGGNRDYLCPDEVGKIQRVLATNASFWQFIDCGERFDGPGARDNPERVVNGNETWDLHLRVFTNVRIKAGAELRITCGLEMPEGALILLEPGGHLMLEREGIVTKAGTCGGGEIRNSIHNGS